MALTQTQLSRMKELVGAGLTRPLAWRREQLQRLSALVEEHESEVLDALAADLGKPPTEAFLSWWLCDRSSSSLAGSWSGGCARAAWLSLSHCAPARPRLCRSHSGAFW